MSSAAFGAHASRSAGRGLVRGPTRRLGRRAGGSILSDRDGRYLASQIEEIGASLSVFEAQKSQTCRADAARSRRFLWPRGRFRPRLRVDGARGPRISRVARFSFRLIACRYGKPPSTRPRSAARGSRVATLWNDSRGGRARTRRARARRRRRAVSRGSGR